MLYEKTDLRDRTHEWVRFANSLTGKSLEPETEKLFPYIDIHDRYDNLGAFILTLNSSIFIKKGTIDEDRGVLGFEQRLFVEKELEKIDPSRLAGAIKIALVHHHPVLIPQLVEPKKKYDAIVDSAYLLGILQSTGFHLCLHGHKHNPYVFTSDTRSAFEDVTKKPMVIVAGGSIGSKDLPDHPRRTNTYNIVKLCWNHKPSHFRINIITRGLVRFKPNGMPLNPAEWHWKTLSSYDESFFGYEKFPQQKVVCSNENTDEYNDLEILKSQKYEKTRGYFPVYELRPSLDITNSYEVILWIEHDIGFDKADNKNNLEEVTWYVDKARPIYRIQKTTDASFGIQLNYSAPFLASAKLQFSDGHIAIADVYVRMPLNF